MLVKLTLAQSTNAPVHRVDAILFHQQNFAQLYT